jgi:hypothetical protein
MNECCENFLGKDLVREEGRKFTLEVLDFMRERLIEYQESTGNLYNLEATPAESTSYRLAKIDKERYPDIKTAGEEAPYYTNSTQLPVDYTSDLFGALDLQEEIQRKYTGGTVFHSFLGEGIEDLDACKKLVRRIAENYRLPYYTISPTFSVCSDHGYLKGEQDQCPSCGKETEVYARIVGYYRPVKNWNKGKAEEYQDRRLFETQPSGNVVTLRGAVPFIEQEKGEHTGTDAASSARTDMRRMPILELNSFAQHRTHRVNGSSHWKLFTTPNCTKCDEVKDSLGTLDFRVEILNLQDNRGRKLFTQYYRQIRDKISRKDTGEMNLPVLLNVGGDGQILEWAMGPQEIREILQD